MRAPLGGCAHGLSRVRGDRPRERQVLELFVAGLEIGSIARHLGISKTVASRQVSGLHRFAGHAGPDETTPERLAAVWRRNRRGASARA